MKLLFQFIDYWIPDRLKADADQHLKGRLMIQSLLLVLPLMAFYAVEYGLLGHYWGVGYSLYGFFCAIFGLWFMRNKGHLAFTGHFFIFTAYVIIWAFTLTTNGLHSMIAPWVIMVPISGFLIIGIRAGIFWSVAAVVQVATLFVVERAGIDMPMFMRLADMPIVNLFSLLGLVGYIVIIFLHNDQGKARLLRDLRQAKAAVEQKNEEITSINLALEDTVAKRTQRLQDANDELDTFLYESSHALRRPLMRILGLLSLVDAARDPIERAEYMQLVSFTAHNMDRMLQDLLLVSEVYQRRLAPADIRLQDEVEKLLLSRPTADVAFEADIAPDLALACDPELLRIALGKLLDNALQYRRKGAAHRVQLVARNAGTHTTITLRDNGIGIDAKAVPQLFKMFARGTEVSRGSGLGLFIVGKAMERLGGDATIDSEKGSHTAVTLRLPAGL